MGAARSGRARSRGRLITLHIDGDRPADDLIEQAAAVLRAGQLLIYPTDTLYALGGVAMRAAAAAQVRAAKGRDDRKPLPLVAASLAQVCALCADWPEAAQALSQLWPGPLTLVLPARADVPHQVTAGTATLAVRIPALALTRALCLAAGPLISTSANLAGEPAPLRCSEAVAAVGAAAVMAIDAGPGTPVASSIVDLSGSRPRLLRAGAVTQAAIERALGVPLDRPGPQAL